MNDTIMIRTERLSKSFKENDAVQDLSVSISSGEVFGLLGPNGAGKTTTIRMLSALIAPSSGTAVVAGYTLGEQDNEIRRRIGILTESPGMYNQLSAERNLSFFGSLYDIQNLDVQIERYLRMLGLWGRRTEPVTTFSKGMRQKLAIARALLHEPDILFLDEPTSGLDPEASRLVREFILMLRSEGRTILISTHNLDEADRLCDRIAVVNTRLVALDTPEKLRRQLFGRRVIFHLASADEGFVQAVIGYEFVYEARLLENKLIVSLDDPNSQNPILIRKLVEMGAEIQFVGELKKSLEDIYLQLVNRTDRNTSSTKGRDNE
ncbi:MAG: ABC transporter ATP-binding protein [Anaerolineales bacterium]|nr:ABC transporter ATP-binding protein [Anaerolineales bacterium]